jgi:hypothetical protein
MKHEYEHIQSRIRIDRFTGGVYPGALFDEQPILGQKTSQPHLELIFEIRKPENAFIGLLLQLLKDLWTEDLPLGGEAGIGRGRLTGLSANLQFISANMNKSGSWKITTNGDGLEIEGDVSKLEMYSSAVKEWRG